MDMKGTNLTLKCDIEDIPIFLVSTWLPSSLVNDAIRSDGYVEGWAPPVFLLSAVLPMLEEDDKTKVFEIVANLIFKKGDIDKWGS
jgi:hypothetical protein